MLYVLAIAIFLFRKYPGYETKPKHIKWRSRHFSQVIRESRFGCPRIARVISSEELGTMSKNNLRQITLVRGPIWGILTLIISWNKSITRYLTLDSVSWVDLNATRAFVIRKLKAKNTREKIPLDLYMRVQVSYAHTQCRPKWEKMKSCRGIGLHTSRI